MKSTALFIALLLGQISFSQVFDTDTLLWNGDADKRINLVILSDGYQESELAQFTTDANGFMNAFLGETPYQEYKNYFNVIAINVPSNESGANHPGTAIDVSEPQHPVAEVDNYFGSSFDSFGIHRLLVAENTSAVYSVLADNFPLYDQVIVIVNSPFYGGSGGQIAVTSTEQSANEIAIHEIGHSFTSLKDEYYAGDIYAAEGINMTQETNANEVRWVNWMDDNGIGIYQHCCGGNSANWYRPHEQCKMRYLGFPFCSVCVEGTIEEIHDRVSPIDSYSPDNGNEVAVFEPMSFEANLIEPNPNTLRSSWLLNSVEIAQNTASVELEAADLEDGINLLQFMVEDTSTYLRVDNHSESHLYTILWELDQSALGITSISEKKISVSLYPNPTSHLVNIKIDDSGQSDFTVRVTDISGREFMNQNVENSSGEVQLDLKPFRAGVYIVNIALDSGEVISKRILKQ